MPTDVITENTTAQNATADSIYAGVVETKIKENTPATAFGAGTNIEVGKFGAGDFFHGLIRFDGLSNIPSSATISAATLYLYQEFSSGTYSIDLRRMLQAWTEAGATWNTYDGTSAWNTAGATGAGTDRVSAVESTTSVSSAGGYHAFDCTSLVQDVVDGTIPSDEGFHLEQNGATTGTFKGFTASESVDGQRPELVVVYTTGGGGGGAETTAKFSRRVRKQRVMKTQ